MAQRMLVPVFAWLALTLGAGCGGPAATSASTGGSSVAKAEGTEKEKKADRRVENALFIVGNAWTSFHREKGVAPKSLSDLESGISQTAAAVPNSPDVLAMIKSGDIVVVYCKGKVPQNADGFIAYAKTTPTDGGPVVTREGAVVRASAETFNRIGVAKPGE